jgi:hypothetical protein
MKKHATDYHIFVQKNEAEEEEEEEEEEYHRLPHICAEVEEE